MPVSTIAQLIDAQEAQATATATGRKTVWPGKTRLFSAAGDG